jgi:RNA polymerase sigma factor (sigma-70 family)
MFSSKRKYYREKSDEELILLYKKDRISFCFGILYERYAHLVMGTCMKYLKNPTQAEDLTMRIFEELEQKLIQHEVTFFKSWLYILTKNACLMSLRKKNKDIPFSDMHLIQNEEIAEEKIVTERKITILEELIPLLKEDQRKCIELFYLKEKSYQQISDVLNMSLLQVKSAIQNGKRNLKIRLEERNEFK